MGVEKVMYKPFRKLCSFETSKKIIHENIRPIRKTEKVNLEQACGRVLAENIRAGIDLPPFSRAAMDGYAVNAQATFGSSPYKPKILKVVGSAQVGKLTARKIKKSEAVRIATGAKLPKGANAVVMVENTEEEAGKVKIFKSASPGENVGVKGEDIKKGSLVLKENEVLTPSKLGILAGLGLEEVKVYHKPRVAIIPTGEELSCPGEKLSPGQVYDINTYTISSLLGAHGAIPLRFDIVPDNLKELRAILLKAVKYDLIVFSGGSSVGERDLLASVTRELGEIKFHGVQIKPGKPTLFGIIKGKPIFGMPGYPTSCLLNTYLFLVPAIRKLARLPEREEKIIKAKLVKRVYGSIGRRFFLTVKIEKGLAVPVFKESGAITSMSEAQGYVEIPENIDVLERGEEVEVKLF